MDEAQLAIPPGAVSPDAVGVETSHHWISDDELYSKRHVIKAGVILGQHSHPYDHASALISGTVRLQVDGAEREPQPSRDREQHEERDQPEVVGG